MLLDNIKYFVLKNNEKGYYKRHINKRFYKMRSAQ